jgi:hypothetical protein
MRCLTGLMLLVLLGAPAVAADGEVGVINKAAAGELQFQIDGETVLAYQYADRWATPHLYPVCSPSGKLLTSQVPDPYPHHHSIYIADHVKLEGHQAVDFYHDWKNRPGGRGSDKPHEHFIRHQAFEKLPDADKPAQAKKVVATLQWTINEDTPVLDERRSMRVIALGDGEYLLDLKWTLTANHGDVAFVSDWVHYAWPYVRMHPQFSGQQGGTITANDGSTGQDGTNAKSFKWIDYSNTVAGRTSGLSVFTLPKDKPVQWLTRNYGTFGPKRRDPYNGGSFTLEKGQSLEGRVGILIHRGDVKTGRVAERYRQFQQGNLP